MLQGSLMEKSINIVSEMKRPELSAVCSQSAIFPEREIAWSENIYSHFPARGWSMSKKPTMLFLQHSQHKAWIFYREWSIWYEMARSNHTHEMGMKRPWITRNGSGGDSLHPQINSSISLAQTFMSHVSVQYLTKGTEPKRNYDSALKKVGYQNMEKRFEQ